VPGGGTGSVGDETSREAAPIARLGRQSPNTAGEELGRGGASGAIMLATYIQQEC